MTFEWPSLVIRSHNINTMYWICFIYFQSLHSKDNKSDIQKYIIHYLMISVAGDAWKELNIVYDVIKNKNELWIRTFLLSYFNCLWSSPWWNWIKEPISRMECLFPLSKGDIVSVVFTGTVLSYAAFVIVVVQLTKFFLLRSVLYLCKFPVLLWLDDGI